MLDKWTTLATCGILISHAAYADVLRENELWKEDGLRAGGLSEQGFNEVIDVANDLFSKILKDNFNAKLKMNRAWSSVTVNARAIQLLGAWQVNVNGGLARRPEITRDGLGLAICHEMGHHLGGYPFSSGFMLSDWAANEGEADYFATIACPRLMWKDQRDINASFRETVDAQPKALCDKVWITEEDQNLCYRTTMAGQSLSNLFAALENTSISWDTPDSSKVEKTKNGHPAPQCRLDTYLAGALCTKNFDSKIIPGKDLGSNKNAKEGELEAVKYSCTQYENFAVGTRPSCWFKSLL